jgi:predicted O-linked N-acetylglucosamine transferase (SPINDLY family)
VSKPAPTATPPAGISKAEAIRRAMTLHRSGKLEEAARLYRAVLAAAPNDFDALHLLGVLLSARRQSAEGIELIKRALALQPDFAGAHNNLGTALLAAKQPAAALASFQRAVELKANFAEAHSNLGNALADLDRREEAVASHRQAIALKPDYAEAYNNLGNVLIALGRFDEAAEACQRALTIRPNYAKAHNNLATARARQRRDEEAIVAFGQAIAANPDFAEAYRGLGNALLALRRDEEAVEALERAIRLRPDDVDAHLSLASALGARRQMDGAAAACRRAIALQPDNAAAHYNLGNALATAGDLGAAAASYRLASAAMAEDCRALLQYVQVSNQMCAWRQAAPHSEALLVRARQESFNALPFPILAVADDPALQHAAARAFVRHSIGSGYPALWNGESYQHQRIKLAYFFCGVGEHSGARLIVDLMERHDRAQFEVFAVSFGPDDNSALQHRMARACDHFIDVRQLADADIAQRLRALEIDVVIDLDGHTEAGRSRALAWRPVPAQVAYLGYPATMGADFIDYAIVDRTVVPEEQQPCFSEKLIYLPDCFQVSDSKRPTPAAAPQRARLGLPDHVLVFCCFNNSYKITAAFFDAWMRLLAAVPGSVLWLVADNRWVEANLKDEARRAGIDPARLIFAPQLDDPSELSHRRAADLFLDTSPYNGGATCNDALWCGLPVIACCGHGFASRMTASLLKAIGMPELVAHSLAQYEDLALTLARSPARLASLKDQLLRNKTRTTLFDTQRFCRNLEAAFGEVRRVSEAGEQPSSFSIELAH